MRRPPTPHSTGRCWRWSGAAAGTCALLHPDATAVVMTSLFAVLVVAILVRDRALSRRLDRLELILNGRRPVDGH